MKKAIGLFLCLIIAACAFAQYPPPVCPPYCPDPPPKGCPWPWSCLTTPTPAPLPELALLSTAEIKTHFAAPVKVAEPFKLSKAQERAAIAMALGKQQSMPNCWCMDLEGTLCCRFDGKPVCEGGRPECGGFGVSGPQASRQPYAVMHAGSMGTSYGHEVL